MTGEKKSDKEAKRDVWRGILEIWKIPNKPGVFLAVFQH
jgi:hypothetical protein